MEGGGGGGEVAREGGEGGADGARDCGPCEEAGEEAEGEHDGRAVVVRRAKAAWKFW